MDDSIQQVDRQPRTTADLPKLTSHSRVHLLAMSQPRTSEQAIRSDGMGTLSHRHHAGHRMGGRRRKKGPLRLIVAVLQHGRGLFDVDHVQLKCGHVESATIGARRAICTQCGKGVGPERT